MKIYDIEKIHKWFADYVNSFADAEENLPPISEIKRQHSYRVESVGKKLAAELKWDKDAYGIAVAASLLHDTGRFSQFRDYGTLSDALSTDHGERGYDDLKKFFSTELADEEGFRAILEAVRFHNKQYLPTHIDEAYKPFCKLVRDADKIDVFELVLKHIDEGTVGELLPRHSIDAPLSVAVLEEVEEHGISSYKNVSSLADFLFLQLTWLLDINYAPSMRSIEERGSVHKIIELLPLTPSSQKASKILDGLLVRIEEHKKTLVLGRG